MTLDEFMHQYILELGEPVATSDRCGRVNRVVVYVTRGSEKIVVATGSTDSPRAESLDPAAWELLSGLSSFDLEPFVPFDAPMASPQLEVFRAGTYADFVTESDQIARAAGAEAFAGSVRELLNRGAANT